MLQHKWKWFYAIISLCLLGTGTLAVIAYGDAPAIKASPWLEATKTVLLCLGGIGVILPVYLNAVSHFEANHQQKIENTFSLISRWDSPELFLARKFTREIKDMHSQLSADSLIKRIKENPDLRQSVILVANYFEHIRFSLETGRIDEYMFKNSMGVTVVDIINRFDPYFTELGQEFKDDLISLKTKLEKI